MWREEKTLGEFEEWLVPVVYANLKLLYDSDKVFLNQISDLRLQTSSIRGVLEQYALKLWEVQKLCHTIEASGLENSEQLAKLQKQLALLLNPPFPSHDLRQTAPPKVIEIINIPKPNEL